MAVRVSNPARRCRTRSIFFAGLFVPTEVPLHALTYAMLAALRAPAAEAIGLAGVRAHNDGLPTGSKNEH